MCWADERRLQLDCQASCPAMRASLTGGLLLTGPGHTSGLRQSTPNVHASLALTKFNLIYQGGNEFQCPASSALADLGGAEGAEELR